MMMPFVKTCKNSAAKNMPNFIPEYSILNQHQFDSASIRSKGARRFLLAMKYRR